MKKSLSALLLAITMLIMLVLPTQAATGRLSATATLSDDGTSFTVDLIVKDNPGIIALTGKLTYDSKVFKLKEAKNGEIFENVFMSSQNFAVNPYQMIWMEATASEDIKTNGVLATYTFEVLKNAPDGESEIRFEIAETVNYAKDSTSQIKGCSFKVKVSGNAGSEVPSATTTVSQDKVNNNETLNVQKPLIDNTQTENAPIESQSGSLTETTSSDMVSQDESEALENNKESNDRTLITVIAIAAVVVLGLGITFTAIYFRKKAGSKKADE